VPDEIRFTSKRTEPCQVKLVPTPGALWVVFEDLDRPTQWARLEIPVSRLEDYAQRCRLMTFEQDLQIPPLPAEVPEPPLPPSTG